MISSNYVDQHKELIERFGEEYFRVNDSSWSFPSEYFEELKMRGLLTVCIEDMSKAYEFMEVAQAIGSYSVAAAITWVMHNQQANTLRMAAHDRGSALSMGNLVASVTSRGRDASKDFLKREGEGFRLSRFAPACSYCQFASAFLVVVPCQLSDGSSEDWLVLVDSERVIKHADAPPLGSNRSTATFPISIDALVASSDVIGPLKNFFAKTFVPIAHIGWMSAYNGGLGGVLGRLKVRIRSDMSFRKAKEKDTAFRLRVGRVLSTYHANTGLLRDCVYQSFGGPSEHFSTSLNSIKVEISEAVLRASLLLSEALGSQYALATSEQLGLETFVRDARAGPLMIHNDSFTSILFDTWLAGRS